MLVRAKDVVIDVDTGLNDVVQKVEGYEITLESGLTVTLDDFKTGKFQVAGRAIEPAASVPAWASDIPVEGEPRLTDAPVFMPAAPAWSPTVDPMLTSILDKQRKAEIVGAKLEISVPTKAAMDFLETMYTTDEIAEAIAARKVKEMIDDPDAAVKLLAAQIKS